MSLHWLTQQSDYLLFATVAVVVMFSLMVGYRRWQPSGTVRLIVWLVLLVILGTGWAVVNLAGQRERHHVMDGVNALAPTYAAELERMGHAAIGLNTPTNDPSYLAMVEAEIRWLKLNPAISDIYTMRLGADGRPYFVVDAETDYDHNGKCEGARESRTAIGEVYEVHDDCLEQAFQGQTVFADKPTLDRWGEWVSAYVPMRDAQGKVEAVLGVDYAATEWVRQTAVMRQTWIGVFALLVAILAGAVGVVAMLRTELAVRFRNEQQLQIQAQAMEAAANAIVITDRAGAIQWVNTAFTTLTGYPAQTVIGQNPRLLKSGKHDAAFYGQLWETISAGRVWSGELVNRRKDGSHYVEAMTITPVHGADEKVVSYIAIKQDITEHRRIENELRWKTAFLEAQIDCSRDGILVVDEHRRKILQNQRMAQLWKIPQAIVDDPDDSKQVQFVTQQVINSQQFYERVTYLYSHPDEIGDDEVRLKDGTILARCSHPVVGKSGTYFGRIWVFRDITERKLAEVEREKMHQQLLDVSRQAGMAEVATSVLHNVGNVLNSVNVTTALMADHIRESKIVNLGRAAALLRDHAADLADFLTNDPRGQLLPAYLKELAEQIMKERAALHDELTELTHNIDHIKVIVAMQQDYGRLSGVVESLSAVDLVEDALRLNEAALHRHEVEVVREYGAVPPVVVEKHKVLQILVNLIRNGKHALDDSQRLDKHLIVRVGMNGSGRVKIQVADNGVGIAPENLTRIFEHGFTTRKEGHGFGLHSGVLAAQELGGALTVHSDGPGKGAVFTLELPRQRSTGK